MALAWIKNFNNRTNMKLTLIQTDPDKHPVLHRGTGIELPDGVGKLPSPFNQDYTVALGQRIVVAPGGNFNSDWFVIPWASYGSLRIGATTAANGKCNELEATVGTFGDSNDDHILFKACHGPSKVQPVQLGPSGPGGWGCSVELNVDVSPERVLFEPVSRQDYGKLAVELGKLAYEFWKLLTNRPK